ncbi:ATP synthase delta chain [hydrothermal vent metagenome]|uniref:ATP synthase delta chain n=1 Tax=hydrothermal vent metagenome TaxID=652676 RepID=A0A3B1B195_9ZZZZ
MAEKSTIARPYAQAAFDLAQEENDLKTWSDMLQLCAMIVNDEKVSRLIGNPEVSKATLVELILNVAGDRLNTVGRNFIRVLAGNGRLNVLSEIVSLYEQHRADAEQRVDAEVISAFPMSDAQQQALAASLKKKLGREVRLTASIDESLIGGAIVRAGDLVIDGSISGHLNKLAQRLIA